VHGGIYATTYSEGAIKNLDTDYVFTGPAENRLPQVLDYLMADNHDDLINKIDGIGYRDKKTGKQKITTHPSFGNIIKHQGTDPDYSKVDIKKYIFQDARIVEFQSNYIEPTMVIQTSFGCVHQCTFCAVQTITGRKMVFRSVETVLDEIGWFMKEFGVKHFGFFDQLLLGNKRRCLNLFQGIIDRKYDIKWKLANSSVWHMHEDLLELMKRSGCTFIGISTESGSQRVLKEIMKKPVDLEVIASVVKKCKELGIDISSYFIIGMPGETWDEILETVDFADRMDFDLAVFNVAQPFAGTPMSKTCMEKGYLPKDFDWTDEKQFGNSKGFITTSKFTPEDLMNLRTYAWDYINFKNHDKKIRAARVLNIPLSEINEHRRQNRMRKGVHAVKQNFTLSKSMDKSFLDRGKQTNQEQENDSKYEIDEIKQKFIDARLKCAS